LKLKEQVEALYAQGKIDDAKAAAAAAAAADGGADGANGAAVGDDAKIADDEDAGVCGQCSFGGLLRTALSSSRCLCNALGTC
jgi:hypothetical protein